MARLTPDNERRARDLIALYPHSRSALIPILHILQGQDGYLSEDGMTHVAEILDLAPAEVWGTATFYDMFHTEPVGRYLIAVCTNIACMLQGAYELLEHAEERLGVAPGGTSPDGMFTLEDAECLALCGNAPCVTANWRFFGDVDRERFDEIVDDLRAGRLDAEVPHHGVLSRVERDRGLQAEEATASEPVPSGPATVDLDTRLTTAATVAHDGGRSGESPAPERPGAEGAGSGMTEPS
ncbi:MAG: NAD(P)H-dependent oxidoreductase subunit E [Acidimicrobiaceae bacterium]|nr:NAD(P)H-dependent oxidoreductase subunit E [Acidimicrobiaceae bacterium]